MLSLNEVLKFSLQECYPNPFNPITTISYEIAKLSDVKISIYNTKGQLVKVLSDKLHEPGEYSIIWNAAEFTSGVYFVHLHSDNFSATQKIMLIK